MKMRWKMEEHNPLGPPLPRGNRARVVFLIATVLLASCAKEMPPPGGPADKTPPEILATTPPGGATMVDPAAPIVVEFSERINGKAIGNALFISPPLKVEPTVRVKGARLRIEPNEPLDSGRTYVITLGASLQDLQGNRLTSSQTLAFSTGEQIDSGLIAGHIYDQQKPLVNFRVFAYANDATLIDSLFVRIPDYITESGSDGSFAFANMKEGEYLVLGVEDKDRDNLISSAVERIALPPYLVNAFPPEIKPQRLDLHVTRYDSTELALINCSEDNGALIVQFAGEPLDPATVVSDSISIVDAEGKVLHPEVVSLLTAEPERVYLWNQALLRDSTYALILRGVRGNAGKRLGGEVCSCAVEYRGVDQVAPVIKERIPAGQTATVYPGDTLRLVFSEPVTVRDSAVIISIDSAQVVFGALTQVAGSTRYKLTTSEVLPAERPLTTVVQMRKIMDRAGNTGADTMYNFKLTVAAPDSLASLSGVIEVPKDLSVTVVFAGATRKQQYFLREQVAGAFKLSLYPDLYTVTAFSDANGNDRWDGGSLRPFGFAERGWLVADSVRVRARFDHEDYVLKLE